MTLLNAAEFAGTVDAIAAVQMPSGLILWHPGGRGIRHRGRDDAAVP